MNDPQDRHQAWSPARQRSLAWFLRGLGVLDMLAFVVVLLPKSVVALAHELAGLGAFPSDPLTGYLARSASLLYAFLGAIAFFMAQDVQRYRPVISLTAALMTGSGVALIAIDLVERMPLWWTLAEGPTVGLIGLILFRLLKTETPAEAR